MNSETLERLLIDKSLGALTSDVQQLLTAYLMSDAEAAQRGREYQETADVLRRGLPARAAANLPAFPSMRPKQAQHARRYGTTLGRTVALAACLLLGLGIGFVIFGRAPLRANSGTPTFANSNLLQPVPEQAPFWSSRRFYERTAAQSRGSQRLLAWDSPVTQPRLRGAT